MPNQNGKAKSRIVIDEEDKVKDDIEDDNEETNVTDDLLHRPGENTKIEFEDEEDEKQETGLSKIARWVSESVMGSQERKRYDRLAKLLARSTLFSELTDQQRKKLADVMTPKPFRKGEMLMMQGERQDKAVVILEGTVVRKRLVEDQLHVVAPLGNAESTDTIGMLHLLKRERVYSSAQAFSDGYAFWLTADDFQDLIVDDPEIAQNVIQSLVVELRDLTNSARTPLFLQQGKEIAVEPLPFFAIAVASGIESFYRSALNALLVGQLGGGKRPALFPNMHVQLPTRVVYITGFKGVRYFLDHNVQPLEYSNPTAVGMALAVAPGILMSPVSSVLEAQNVTHMNSEPLMLRWTRGLMPRVFREVTFGIGINQLSDYFEERFDNVFTSTKARNFAGSMTAGAIAGYVSHVPHNLSMLKLMKPQDSYAKHMRGLSTSWENWWMKSMPNTMQGGTSQKIIVPTLSVLLPKGCLIRTAQISGSFLIINSAINALKVVKVNWNIDPSSGVLN